MTTDYPKYEGKEVTINIDEDTYQGIVVGCDYDIGISIADINDKTRDLCCIPGPSTKNHYRSIASKEIYDSIFTEILSMIMNGSIDGNLIEKIQNSSQKSNSIYGGRMVSCPFK